MRKLARLGMASAIVVAVIATAVLCVRLWPREPLAAQIPSSTAIFDRDGRLLRLTLASD